MIIAVVAVRMVQVAVDEVVDVVAMRDSLVAAVRTMDVPWFVTAAGVSRSAGLGIRVTDGKGVFFNGSSICLMMKVSVMQVVDVSLVLDGRVTAACSVLVIVILMAL